MSITSDIVTGFATTLSAGSVCTYRSDGSTYLSTETALTVSLMPQTPDRCIALYPYTISDDPVLAMGRHAMQLRFRGNPGDPLDVMNLRDAAYAVLQGLTRLTWGTVYVDQIARNSSISNGQDDSLRFEYFDSYYFDVDLPVTANRS